jgi:hypothetical protein
MTKPLADSSRFKDAFTRHWNVVLSFVAISPIFINEEIWHLSNWTHAICYSCSFISGALFAAHGRHRLGQFAWGVIPTLCGIAYLFIEIVRAIASEGGGISDWTLRSFLFMVLFSIMGISLTRFVRLMTAGR